MWLAGFQGKADREGEGWVKKRVRSFVIMDMKGFFGVKDIGFNLGSVGRGR